MTIIAENAGESRDDHVMCEPMVPLSTVEAAKAELLAISEQILDLFDRRRSLMRTTLAELLARGIDAHVVKRWSCELGDRGGLVTSYAPGRDPETWFHPGYTREVCTWSAHGSVYVGHGTYEVVLQDGSEQLITRVPDVDDVERGHRRSVARLRSRARRDDLRVSVRDRDVSLIDPMGTIAHCGTLETAWLWIEGFDLEGSQQ